MDSDRFDALARSLAVAGSRRRALRGLAAAAVALLGGRGPDDAAAHDALTRCRRIEDARKRRACVRQAKAHNGQHCGAEMCPAGTFCCDDQRQVCCPTGASCCNPGPGTGSCCPNPDRCARPFGNDAAPNKCCPPERAFQTSAGLDRCCPPGTRSLGGAVTSEGGPCCPEAQTCGTTCCVAGLVCANPATGRCCTPDALCGTTCCATSSCFACVSGSCQYRCATNQFCSFGVCRDCGPFGCGG